MVIYCYLVYKTEKGKRGAFRIKVDSQKLMEIMNYSLSLPINEHGDACIEFTRCLNKMDSGIHHTIIFKDSILSQEIMAYYLLSASTELRQFVDMKVAPVLHCTYDFDAASGSEYKIRETIYPGPDAFAPESAVESWIKLAF
jgi:hypothetical protein